MSKLTRTLALAFSGLLLVAGPGARADQVVTFVTTGYFGNQNPPGSFSGLNPYTSGTTTADKVQILFVPATNGSATVPPGSQASFGQFNTQGTTATSFQNFNVNPPTFTLNIFETGPDVASSPLQFVGSISGQIKSDNSGLFLVFNSPLSQTFNGAHGSFLYQILSADSGTPGRVNIAPPSTNGGLTTIQGFVGPAVPEPSSIAMLTLGGVATVFFGLRSRRNMSAAKLA